MIEMYKYEHEYMWMAVCYNRQMIVISDNVWEWLERVSLYLEEPLEVALHAVVVTHWHEVHNDTEGSDHKVRLETP